MQPLETRLLLPQICRARGDDLIEVPHQRVNGSIAGVGAEADSRKHYGEQEQ